MVDVFYEYFNVKNVLQLEKLRNHVVQDIFLDQNSESRDISDDGIVSMLKIYLCERSDCQKKVTVCIYFICIFIMPRSN